MVSQSQAWQPAKVDQPRVLLVEGNDDRNFFQRLIERRQNLNVQVIEYRGSAQLGNFLANTLVNDPMFSGLVEVVGVVRDADGDYQSAFDSVQGSLSRACLPVPDAPMTIATGSLDGADIRVAVYVMPDNASPGDLESLCLEAIRDAPAVPCVDKYFECLKSVGDVPRQESKARLRAFLASNAGNPTLRTGDAIAAGVIPWNSPAFDGVHKFLDMLDAAD